MFLPFDIYERPVLIQLIVFTMSVHAGFIPTSLYLELASAGTGKRWRFCRFSERFIGFVYDNHMAICWENTVGTKSAKPTISSILDRRVHTLMHDTRSRDVMRKRSQRYMQQLIGGRNIRLKSCHGYGCRMLL